MSNQTPILWHPMTSPPRPCPDCNGQLEDRTDEYAHRPGEHFVIVRHDDTCPWYRAYLDTHGNRAERRANRKARR
ncbi:hypothetical protein AS590_10635 [Prescottella equi]|nr:hypothetical protein AS590_10635 [Prescottella equi]